MKEGPTTWPKREAWKPEVRELYQRALTALRSGNPHEARVELDALKSLDPNTLEAGALRIRLAPMATLQLRSATRLDSDRLVLQLRRPDGAWGEPIRCEGLAGRTQLLAWSVLPGVWDWRLRLPTRGADNRGSAAWHQGRCEVAAGAEAAIEVRER